MNFTLCSLMIGAAYLAGIATAFAAILHLIPAPKPDGFYYSMNDHR